MVKVLSEKKISKLAADLDVNREFLATFLQSYGTVLYRKQLRLLVNALLNNGEIDHDELYAYALKDKAKGVIKSGKAPLRNK